MRVRMGGGLKAGEGGGRGSETSPSSQSGLPGRPRKDGAAECDRWGTNMYWLHWAGRWLVCDTRYGAQGSQAFDGLILETKSSTQPFIAPEFRGSRHGSVLR